MEDAHSAVLDLKPSGSSLSGLSPADTRLTFFGVYDGHGGDKVAIYTGENLHKIISKQADYKIGGNLEKAIKDGFLNCDRDILSGKHYTSLLWISSY
jgi:protein phosphatase 2C family protein 2/3